MYIPVKPIFAYIKWRLRGAHYIDLLTQAIVRITSPCIKHLGKPILYRESEGQMAYIFIIILAQPYVTGTC